MRLRLTTLVLALLAGLILPASASAHAVLESTEPSRGASLERSPELVSFRFNEPVEASFGAVRVYDRGGDRVDNGELVRPGDHAESVGTELDPELPDGIYTATYRVISADSHPVSGGFTFTVGDPGAASGVTLDELIDEGGAGPVTDAALGITRALTYLATAIVIGGVVFLLVAWSPAVSAVSGAGSRWADATAAFATRLRRLFAVALGVGAVATVLGIAMQGAIGLGDSLWAALRPDVLGDVLETRFGTVWALRLADLAVLGGLLLIPAVGFRYGALAPARLGATGNVAPDPLPGHPLAVVLLGLGLGFLALAPGLAGHAGVVEPSWLLLSTNWLHVLAFAAWAGGLIVLLAAVPAATGRLKGGAKTALLTAVVERFSGLALVAVGTLLTTGIVQSLVQLEAWSNLLDTGYGRAILVKAALLGALIGLGAVNRQRLRPRLGARAREGETPGRTGAALRKTIRAEVGLIAAVLSATAVLAALAPPASTSGGPFSTSADLGPARLELTVDPATVGSNEIHLYLFDRETGAHWNDPRELSVTAALPEREIGPLEEALRKSGPGHYVIRDAALGVSGEWTLAVSARVSRFDEYRAGVEVPIR